MIVDRRAIAIGIGVAPVLLCMGYLPYWTALLVPLAASCAIGVTVGILGTLSILFIIFRKITKPPSFTSEAENLLLKNLGESVDARHCSEHDPNEKIKRSLEAMHELPHNYATGGKYEGIVYTAPFSRWTSMEVIMTWPPPSPTFDVWWASLDQGTLILKPVHRVVNTSKDASSGKKSELKRDVHNAPVPSRSKSSASPVSGTETKQRQTIGIPLEGCKVEIDLEVLEGRSQLNRRVPLLVSHPAWPLLEGECSFYLVAYDPASKQQWWHALNYWCNSDQNIRLTKAEETYELFCSLAGKSSLTPYLCQADVPLVSHRKHKPFPVHAISKKKSIWDKISGRYSRRRRDQGTRTGHKSKDSTGTLTFEGLEAVAPKAGDISNAFSKNRTRPALNETTSSLPQTHDDDNDKDDHSLKPNMKLKPSTSPTPQPLDSFIEDLWMGPAIHSRNRSRSSTRAVSVTATHDLPPSSPSELSPSALHSRRVCFASAPNDARASFSASRDVERDGAAPRRDARSSRSKVSRRMEASTMGIDHTPQDEPLFSKESQDNVSDPRSHDASVSVSERTQQKDKAAPAHKTLESIDAGSLDEPHTEAPLISGAGKEPGRRVEQTTTMREEREEDVDATTLDSEQFLNAAIARVCFDLLRNPAFAELVRSRVQRQLGRMPTPSWVTSLEVIAVEPGATPPSIARIRSLPSPSDPVYPQVVFDFRYQGSFTVVIECVVDIRDAPAWEHLDNAISRIGGKTATMDKLASNSSIMSAMDSLQESESSGRMYHVDSEYVLEERSELDEHGDEGFGGIDSESDRAVELCSESPDDGVSDERSASGSPASRNKQRHFLGALRNQTAKTLRNLAEQTASHIKRTPLQISLTFETLEGTIGAWIPPPPGDRLFWSFMSPPKLSVKATPKIGGRLLKYAVHASRVSSWLQKRMEISFRKNMVYPSGADIAIFLLIPLENPRCGDVLPTVRQELQRSVSRARDGKEVSMERRSKRDASFHGRDAEETYEVFDNNNSNGNEADGGSEDDNLQSNDEGRVGGDSVAESPAASDERKSPRKRYARSVGTSSEAERNDEDDAVAFNSHIMGSEGKGKALENSGAFLSFKFRRDNA